MTKSTHRCDSATVTHPGHPSIAADVVGETALLDNYVRGCQHFWQPIVTVGDAHELGRGYIYRCDHCQAEIKT